MKKIKLHTKIFSILFVILSVLHFQSCMDLSSNPEQNTNPSNSKIQIISPANSGTLMYGKNEIIYSLLQPYSIKFIELYLDGVFFKNIPPNGNGTAPEIILNLDSSDVGKKINLYLIFYDNDGTSHKSNVVNQILITGDTRIPFKPYNVSLINFRDASCNISWKDSSLYVEKYQLWRKIDFTGEYILHQELSSNSFNTNDYNLDTNKIYFYKIRGIKSSDVSEFSNEVNTAGIVTSGNLYPPSNLTASISGVSEVTLNWTDNSENENYFAVERSLANGNFNRIAVLGRNTTIYKDSGNGLVTGTTYNYRIKVYSNTDSASSNIITIRISSNILLPPTSLTANYNSSIGVIELHWLNNDNNTLYFDIERKTENTSFTFVKRIDAGSNLYLDFNITTNQIYTYRIRGFDSNIYSDYSNEVSISTF